MQRTGVAIVPALQPLMYGLEPVGLHTEVVKGKKPVSQLPPPGCEPLPHVLCGSSGGTWPLADAAERSRAMGGSYLFFLITHLASLVISITPFA
jgi:hypothetical protein